MGVLPSRLKHGGIDKGAEGKAEMDRPSAPQAYVCMHDWVLLQRKDFAAVYFPCPCFVVVRAPWLYSQNH
jgi:hypothetical protein